MRKKRERLIRDEFFSFPSTIELTNVWTCRQGVAVQTPVRSLERPEPAPEWADRWWALKDLNLRPTDYESHAKLVDG